MITIIAKQLLADISQYLQTSNNNTQEAFSSTTSQASPQLQAIVEATLRRLKLVTRDEFDAQTAVLHRTRSKVEQLEKQLNELEASLHTSSNNNHTK